MTTIDRDRLRKLADTATPGPWEQNRSIVRGPRIAPDEGKGPMRLASMDGPWREPEREANAEFVAAAREAVPALLDALTRAEAQSETRRQQTKYWKERAEEFEAERAEWRQTALDERGAALDALEQVKARDKRIQAVQDLVDQADHAGNWTVTCTHLQWAIDG